MHEFQPSYHNEAGVIRDYLPKLATLNGGEACQIDGILAIDPGDGYSRAWRIRLNATSQNAEIREGIIMDWDETIEPYAERKQRLHTELAHLFPSDESIQQAPALLSAINKAARVLPVTGAHPERYAPMLELAGITQLVTAARSGEQSMAIDESLDMRKSARAFLQAQVLPLFGGRVIAEESGDTTYFREQVHQATAIDFSKKPPFIDEDIWQGFIAHMTGSNIHAEELGNFDLPQEIPWIVATFGAADFQLPKIVNGLTTLQEHGRRMPDEVIIFTRGRKKAVLEKIVAEAPKRHFVFVDDSMGHVISADTIERVTAVHARRGETRMQQEIPADIRSVDMRSTRLTEIVNFTEKREK